VQQTERLKEAARTWSYEVVAMIGSAGIISQ